MKQSIDVAIIVSMGGIASCVLFFLQMINDGCLRALTNCEKLFGVDGDELGYKCEGLSDVTLQPSKPKKT